MLAKWMPSYWKKPKVKKESIKYVMQARYATFSDGYFMLMRYFNEDTARDYGVYNSMGTPLPELLTDSEVTVTAPINNLMMVVIDTEPEELYTGRVFTNVSLVFAEIALGVDVPEEQRRAHQYINKQELSLMVEMSDLDAFTVEIKRALEKAHHTRTILRYV